MQTIKAAVVAIAARFGIQIGEQSATREVPTPKPPPIPRPPGMRDDHPLVLNGRYQ
jgi:hypothetical protein